METKLCSRCKETKTIEHFRRDIRPKYKDNIRFLTVCKECESAMRLEKKQARLDWYAKTGKTYPRTEKQKERKRQWALQQMTYEYAVTNNVIERLTMEEEPIEKNSRLWVS